jgi:integrase
MPRKKLPLSDPGWSPFGTQHGSVRWFKPYVDKKGRQKGGLWVVDIFVAGHRVQEYHKDKAQAEFRLAELRNTRTIAALPRTKHLTVGEFLNQWLAEGQSGLAYNTFRRYHGIATKHLIPAFDKFPLKGLTSEHIQKMIDAKAKTLKPRTVFHVRAVLRNALADAVHKGLIEKNPAEGRRTIKLPRIPDKEPVPWGKTERKKFLEAIKSDPLEPLYLVLFWHGLRISEALGLTWNNVDLDAGTLFIYQQLQYQKADGESQKPFLVEAKTGSKARRTNDLHPSVREALAEVRKAWKGSTGIANLVFVNGGNLPLHDNAVRNRLEAILTKAGLPVITLHDFRDLCCVAMAEGGVPIHYASQFLGHENVQTTLRWYSVARQQDMGDALAKYWTGSRR